jgi:hypothetical protein
LSMVRLQAVIIYAPSCSNPCRVPQDTHNEPVQDFQLNRFSSEQHYHYFRLKQSMSEKIAGCSVYSLLF